MTQRVPLVPPLPPRTRVLSGVAVAAPTWKPLSQMANFIIGRGAALTPAFCPTHGINPSITKTLTLRAIPRGIALRRLYVVRCSGLIGGTTFEITINGTTSTHRVSVIDRNVSAFEYIEDVAAPAATAEETLTVAVKNVGGSTGFVYSVAVYEIPRSVLQQSSVSEYGTDSSSCLPRMPISDRDDGSVGGVARAINAGECIGRRSGLFSYALDEADAYATTSGSYSSVFSLPVPILARRRNYTSATGDTQWRLYARCTTAATTGNVRLTAASGASVVIAVSGAATTAFGLWPTLPAVATLAVDAEDTSTDDGRIAGAWDEVTVEAQRTAGGGNLEIAGVFAFEAPC